MTTEHVLVPQLQLFAIAVLLLFLGWVVRLVRAHRLSLRDSLIWFVSTSAALVVTVFPQILYWVTHALGIQVASNALFALAFVYILLNLLSGTIAISNNADRVRRLAQECALLRAELTTLRARLDASEPASVATEAPAPQPRARAGASG